MNHPKNLNNVAYWWIKTIKVFGTDYKSKTKMNNYLDWLTFKVKYLRKNAKMTTHDHNNLHYSTLLDIVEIKKSFSFLNLNE